MESLPNSTFRPYLASAISLIVLGFGSAGSAIFALTPTLWARWLLFFGGTLGLTGLALPVTWFFNLRFPSNPPVGPYVIVRQAIWVGVFGVVLAWVFLGEKLALYHLAGIGLILAGITITSRAGRRGVPVPAATD